MQFYKANTSKAFFMYFSSGFPRWVYVLLAGFSGLVPFVIHFLRFYEDSNTLLIKGSAFGPPGPAPKTFSPTIQKGVSKIPWYNKLVDL